MNDTCTLIVRLPADRDHLGTLELRDAKSRRLAGPFEVCGRADDTVARRNRNPTRNPLLPHGDMPLGEYRVKAGAAVDEVELEPRNGDAALADANGRFRFLIQGGGLRPMDDGLRLADSDLRELLRALGRLQGETCTCVVLKADAGRNKVPLTTPAPAPARRETPPPTPAPIMMSRTPRRSRLLMVFWLRALMGATGALVAMRSALGAIAASPPPDPSGDLRSVLSARGSSTSPVKPRFSPGRLFARMGGDYSQPEEEETPAQQPSPEAAPQESAPAQAPAEPEEEQEQQAPAEPEQQAPAEQEQQAPAEQGQQAPAEQEQQAPAEQQQQQAPAEQEQQQEAPAEQQQAPEQEQQAPAEQEQQAPAEQEQQAPAEQEQQAPAEQQQAPAPAEPGGDTDAMDQLKNAEEKSQEAAKNPSLEGAHEDASQPFDKGGPIGTPTQEPNTVAPPTPGAVQVPLTPFPQGTQPGQTGSTDQPEQQAPQRSEPAQPQQVQSNQPDESQEDQSGEAQPEENPSEETSPAQTQPAEETHTQQAQPSERQSVQPPLAVPFGQRQGARPPARPAPVATPAWGGLDDIAAVNALAVRWRFTAEQRRLLDIALQAGRLRRAAAATQDPAVIAAWQAIEARGQDPVLAREASNGHGLGSAGAGTQSFNDCPIFALSNAAALPYGVVAARAGELLRDATWHDADERANPQAVIEQSGLSMPEVIMLSQDVGRGAIVQSGGFAAALGQGHPIIVGVAMQDGDWSHGHMVALTTTFQHDGETWYVMMDSNQDSMERRFLSARELDAIRETNGLAFSPNPGQIPQVPRR